MLRFQFVAAIVAIIGGSPARADSAGGATIQLTGWWLNPTPNNAWLRDGHDEYVVSEQGGNSADGDWPEFPRARFVRTNGGYGYGCASLRAQVDGKRVVRIDRAASLPLRRCRASVALRKAEPLTK